MAIWNKKNNENAPEEPVNNAAAPENAGNAGEEKALDFNRYFLADRRIMLENVSYETGKPEQSANGYRLTGKDSVVAQLVGNSGVKVTYNRTLKFEPDGPFTISVSYAVMLVFNPGTRDEVDWKTVDIAPNSARTARTSLVRSPRASPFSSAKSPPLPVSRP